MLRVKTYHYLTLARAKIFDAVRPLAPADYTREFPIGLGSLARTLTHVMICEWMYVERMTEHDVPPYDHWPIQDENPPPFPDLETAWHRQSLRTRSALAAIKDWNAQIEYQPLPPTPTPDTRHLTPEIISTTPDDIFTQLTFHEVHHRAQAMNMLRHMGITLDDIDYNALMYHRRPQS